MNQRHLSLIALLVASVVISGCGPSTERAAPTDVAAVTIAPAPKAASTIAPTAIAALQPAPTERVDPSPTPISSTVNLDNALIQEMIQRCSQEFASLQGGSIDRPLLKPGGLYALIGQDGGWTELSGARTPLRTSDPSQAGYLLCVQQTKTQTGTYTDNQPGYQVRWDVHLVSFPEQTVRRGLNFTGEKPPFSKNFTGPAFGAAPFRELVDWIAGWEAPPATARQSSIILGQDGVNMTPLALAFTPDGQALISGEMHGGLYKWQLAAQPEPEELERHENEIYGLALTRDGKLLAVADRDQRVTVSNLTTGAEVSDLSVMAGYPRSVALSPDGALVASGTDCGQIMVFNVASGENLFTFGAEACPFSSLVAMSPDGKRLTGIQTGPVAVTWNLETGQEINRIPVPAGLAELALLNDGQNLAGVAGSGEVVIWDAGGNKLRSFQAAQSMTAAFSPDGRLLATGSYQGGVKLWDLQTGKPSDIILAGPADGIWDLVFSPDSRRLAAAAGDTKIYLWDVSQDSSTTSPSHSPSATLTRATPAGECLWNVDIELAGFAPTSAITVTSNFKGVECAGATVTGEPWTDSLGKTDATGQLKVSFGREPTADYLFVFADEAGNQASLPFSPKVEPAAIARVDATATATAATRPKSTPTAVATGAPEVPAADRQAIVQSATLNLRSGPGQGYPVVGQLSRGDKLYPTARVGGCQWIQAGVLGQNDLVWVAGGSQYVTLNIPCSTLMVVDDMWPTPVPVPTTAVDAPRPATGLISRSSASSGPGELLIKNGTDSDGVVILVDAADGPIQAAYIRAAESYRMTQIADGTYRLYFSKGEGWDAGRKEFARNITRQRFADTLDFFTQGGQYTGYEVTLYGVAGGNAGTQNVPAGQFPAVP